MKQNLQLPVRIWKITPTCYYRNKGEVTWISVGVWQLDQLYSCVEVKNAKYCLAGVVTYIYTVVTRIKIESSNQGCFWDLIKVISELQKSTRSKNAQLQEHLLLVKILILVTILKANLLLHTTPASSECEQSCIPTPLCVQLVSWSSVPLQRTSSRKMGPTPRPKLALLLDVAANRKQNWDLHQW